jgi:ABC-type lipoprotein release transport system permease subunit
VVTIAIVLALACLGPARRAANADPIGVLRDPG